MSYVYFIKHGDAVKIGFARDVKKRVGEIQVGCSQKVELLGVCRGSMKTEKRFHQRLASDRIRGEWFSMSPAVERTIQFLGIYKEPTPVQVDEMTEDPYVIGARRAAEKCLKRGRKAKRKYSLDMDTAMMTLIRRHR